MSSLTQAIITDLDAEIGTLNKKVAYLTVQINILKETLHTIAKQPGFINVDGKKLRDLAQETLDSLGENK